jgi:hypothetical protein
MAKNLSSSRRCIGLPAPGCRAVLLIVVAGLLTMGCGAGGPADPGPPVDPHPVGETAEVGGWHPVQTLLVESSAEVESAGDARTDGWLVTVVSPSGECPGDPMTQGAKQVVCVGLEIANKSTQTGGLRIFDDLPLLSDSAGEASQVVELRVADGSWMLGAESEWMTSAADCTFSAPDEQGVQQADCTAMVVFGTRGGDMSTGWVAVGAGKTARFDLEYIVAPGGSGLGLWWPDGTWLAIP